MGIQGLLPFLKAIHKPVNVADFQGCTVAIDAYCWLHKGAFSCAEKLALGEKTDQYVYYCMKYIEYMLRKNLKPILVFDGCHLKSKADVEKTRRERRELHRKKAAQFLREGRRAEAKECLQRCVDITPQMALELMNACRDRGVDCIVAPYEADAQLAYLNLKGIAQVIVTEDSDLLLFGCDKIIFKMDFYGNGTLIEKSRLNEVLAIQGGFYTFEKFRYTCILSGCDYLSSLPGIGLAKASKVFKTARQPDLRQLLKKLPTYLKMNITVTEDYIEGFIRADNTFLYQLVFDPISRRLCPLNPYPPEIDRDSLDYAGQYLPEEKAFQIALGNVDIHDHKCIAYFDPDTFVPNKCAKPKFRHQLSIWDKNYRIKSGSPCKDTQLSEEDRQQLSLHGKEKTVKMKPVRRKSPSKQAREVQEQPDRKTDEELLSIFENEDSDDENENPEVKRVRRNLMDSLSEPNFTESNSQVEEIRNNFDSALISSTPLPTKEKQKNNSFNNESDSDENNDREDEQNRRKGKKRKLSGTPSKLTAANIGEEAFKANSEVPKTSVHKQTHAVCRNKFAVPANAVKAPKFDLNAPAVHVKSRYFQSSGSTASQKTESSSQNSATSTTKKKTPQKTIRSMFENVPIKTKQNSDSDDHKRKTPKKTGMHRYFSSAGSGSQTAKESFNSLKTDTSFTEKDDNHVTNFQKRSSKQSQNSTVGSSVFDKFQSAFSRSNTSKRQTRPSQGSAFSWSTAKFTPHTNSEVPDQNKCQDDTEMGEAEEKSPAFVKENHKDLKGSVSGDEALSAMSDTKTVTDAKAGPSLSQFFRQPQMMTGSPCGEKAAVVSVSLHKHNSEKSTTEVTELKSYNYDEFLKSLSRETNTSEDQATNDEDMQAEIDSQADSYPNVNDSQDIGRSISQNLDDSSQMSESGTQETNLSSEKPALVKMGSHRGSIGSIDSFCYPSSQEIVDLTDVDDDSLSQNSSSSTLSKSSSLSGRQACRVSGLSRNKNKSSKGKKTSSAPAVTGQKSIKDLMSKFQFTRNTPKSATSTRVCSVDEDDDAADDSIEQATPLTSKMNPESAKAVQRKLRI